jgi:predicted nucleic acid-binding protein
VVRRGSVAALDLTLYEVANVAVVRWRTPPIARDLVRAIRVACGARLVRVDADLVEAAIEIADAEGLTAYDAAYVACARREGWRLISADLGHLVRPGHAVSPDAAVTDPAP